ncbi:MAG TPA: FUSC family protein, partial [Acidimicrobiales bacterium]|nr:FUSC family protein [Acidimicrobiales bacterium]
PTPVSPAADRPPAVAWDWSAALLGLAFAVPAALVARHDVGKGAAFAVGVIPPAVVGLRPLRKGRMASAVLGVLVAVPILAGSILANVPVVAVVGVFLAGIGAALLAQRSRLGSIALALGLPMIGIGLSYTDVATAAGLAIVMLGGAVYAAAVSLLWPESDPLPPPPHAPPVPTLAYGVLLGATGATAAAIGFALDLDHVGWACAAALLVIRPSAEMQEIRSAGRIASVAIGALLAIGIVRLEPAAGWYGAAIVVVVATVAATRGSRWYITSAFTTFLVFVLLLAGNAAEAASRFDERLSETLLGVGLAGFFGLVIPKLADLDTLQPAPSRPAAK